MALSDASRLAQALKEHLEPVDEGDTLPQPEEGVTLSTVHAAKGREWRVVFVLRLNQGEFPLERAGCTEEEERRLMYVAMTRAKDLLVMSHIARGPLGAKQPSTFLRELPGSCTHELMSSDDGLPISRTAQSSGEPLARRAGVERSLQSGQELGTRSEAAPPSISTQSISQDIFCSACGGDTSEEGNAIVLCDGCDVAVHQVG